MTNNTDATHNTPPPTEHSHLKEYLDYYKTLSNPGYGVLVTGDWGSGKTHQITEILNKNEFHYISLFGSQTTEEIYSAVFAKMYPAKATTQNIANSTNGTGIGVGSAAIYVGGLLSGVVNAIIREQVNNDKIIVFDDLERSKINTNDLLGIFNKYIEHHDCKVIVLAHDKKITAEFDTIKEKVFGQTIAITPQTSRAFDSFVSTIKNDARRELIIKLKSLILDIFEQSKTHSLRILKHSIEDISRLYENLSNEHQSNDAAVIELTSLFLALSLEVRAGRLNKSNLTIRSMAINRFKSEIDQSKASSEVIKLYDTYLRYTNINLGSLILNDETLTNILTRGIYSQTNIHKCLNESLYFTKPTDLPAWLVFIKFDELSEAESRDAAEKLKQQFDDRSIDEPGEMLHLFSLRFLLSEMKLIPKDFNQTEDDCKKYMDDLLDENRMKSFTGHVLKWGEHFSDSYAGYRYWVEDDFRDNFIRITSYLRESQSRAAKKNYPEYIKTLIKLMNNDGRKFAEKICFSNGEPSDYAAIDVLSEMRPIDFVQEWMGSEAKNWGHISNGLEKRYSSGQLQSTLKSEKKWILEVITIIDDEMKKATGIRKKRIQRIFTLNFRDYVSNQ